jgi:hypothetical protein
LAINFKRISGVTGDVTVPSIGLTVGTMQWWELTRREETTPELGEWTLRVVFSYINKMAWEKKDLTKQITVTLGNPKKDGRQYRLEMLDGRTVLDGRSLLIEGVKLHALG